jgi:hypothetical protein
LKNSRKELEKERQEKNMTEANRNVAKTPKNKTKARKINRISAYQQMAGK